LRQAQVASLVVRQQTAQAIKGFSQLLIRCSRFRIAAYCFFRLARGPVAINGESGTRDSRERQGKQKFVHVQSKGVTGLVIASDGK
jgi:hypothetical protein